jgi:hypothetical protein
MPVKIVSDSDNELLKAKHDPITQVAAEEFHPSGKRIQDREEFRASLKKEWEEPDGYLFRSEVYCPRCGMEMIDEMLDKGQVGPPGPVDDPDYVTDSEVIPQPLLSLESGAETCANCGDPIEKEAIVPGEYTPEDEQFMKEMKIWGSLKGLVDTVQPHNPLLQPPDPETATFFKESEGDGPHCPHCGSSDYGLMPTDFETAKCNACGKNWNHGIVKGINDPKTAAEPGPEGFPPLQRELDYSGWSTIGNLNKYLTQLYNAWLNKEITREEYEAEHYLANAAYNAAKAAWVDPEYRELAKTIDSSAARHDVDFMKSIGISSSKTATEKSFGTGTPIGGAPGAPVQNDPNQPRWTAPTPPKPAQTNPQTNSKALPSSAPDQQQAKPTGTEQQQVKQVVNDLAKDNPQVNRAEMEDVVEKVQDKMSALDSEVKIYDSTDMLPPRTELRKHLDPTLIDESTKPPRPLKKGADWTGEDEPEGEVTDMGTLYGKPLGGPKADDSVKDRLEYLRSKLRAENISTSELLELQELADHIEPGDVELLEAAGVPENEETSSEPIIGKPAFAGPGIPHINLKCKLCGVTSDELNRTDIAMGNRFSKPSIHGAEGLMHRHFGYSHWDTPFGPEGYEDVTRAKPFRPTKGDKDFMKSLGIKSSKIAADAEGWWRSTQNTERRNVADKLGIDKYWSHFTWDSLPEEIKQKVNVTLPELERKTQIEKAWEGPAHVSERDQQIREAWNAPAHTAAGKDWDPLVAKKLYDEGAAAAKQGNWDVAHSSLVQSLVHNPYNGQANFLLGIVFAQMGENKAAIQQLEQALRTDPKERYAYHSMVMQMDRDGDLESLEPEVKNFLLDNMVSKAAAAKIAVPIEEGNLVCPHCKCDKTKPVEDSEAEGVNLVECMNCGVFFSK